MTDMAETSSNGISLQVMVVDDSAVIRGLISRMLEGEPDIDVVASIGNGLLAVNYLERHPKEIDVIILDIEMPVMDGLTALPKLLALDSKIKVIIASTLTKKNAEISLRALSAGASDYIPKPSSAREISGESDFRRDLIEKVKGLGIVHKRQIGASLKRARGPAPRAKPGAKSTTGWASNRSDQVVLRKPGTIKPDILAIGSSTGGPQALFEFLKRLPQSINLPIVITQHMPATFTAILAEHITRMTGWPCAEAKTGDEIKSGRILLAPGEYHMTVVQKGTQRVISLNQDAPENFCRPAVDPMLRSLVKVYGGRVFTVILTGMGNDGTKGAQFAVDAGGTVIAQDEKTSVVWGMPGAAAAAGLCSAVLPIADLPGYVMRFAGRK